MLGVGEKKSIRRQDWESPDKTEIANVSINFFTLPCYAHTPETPNCSEFPKRLFVVFRALASTQANPPGAGGDQKLPFFLYHRVLSKRLRQANDRTAHRCPLSKN